MNQAVLVLGADKSRDADLPRYRVRIAQLGQGEIGGAEVTDLAGLSRTRPGMAMAHAALMFSMAGIPPLAGIWGKFYIFVAAVNGGLVWLAVAGVLASCVGAYYYLRIIKIMYFDEAGATMDKPTAVTATLFGLSSLAMLALFIVPAPFVNAAEVAAKSLFAG